MNKTISINYAGCLVLLCICCLSHIALAQRKYFDAKAFDLKGHVKECTIIDETNLSGFDALLAGGTSITRRYHYVFMEDGSIFEYLSDRNIDKTVRDSEGQLVSYISMSSYPRKFEFTYDPESGMLAKSKEIVFKDKSMKEIGGAYDREYVYSQQGVISTEKGGYLNDDTKYQVLPEWIDSHGNWIKRKIVGSDHWETREIEYFPEELDIVAVNKSESSDLKNKPENSSIEYIPYSEISKSAGDKDLQGFKMKGKILNLGEFEFQWILMYLSGWTWYDSMESARDFFVKEGIAGDGLVEKNLYSDTKTNSIRPYVDVFLSETFDVEGGKATLGSRQQMSGIIFNRKDDGSEKSIRSYMNLYPRMKEGTAPSSQWSKKNLNKILKNYYNKLLESLKSQGYNPQKNKQKYYTESYVFTKNGVDYTVSLDMSVDAWRWSNIEIQVDRTIRN